ncbi:phosphonate ABC transporter, permease protein PhnE [Desulfatitalea tepidiphila]|uniref:phosphonate ABC transporter, permease protein PhnE n=1 Tax=Desulfatitalea tepidiphila TaxID=1185843 RepID=UPI0006B4092D|nr:phosphonate ABC transporter, permease protein PhnE [Desulfatitalea tepidiphila]
MTPLGDALDIPDMPLGRKLLKLLAWLVFAMILAWAWQGAEMRPLDLLTYRGNMAAYLSGFLKPDFTEWRQYLHHTAVTIQIAIWGSLLAVAGAVPFGLLSATNVAPVWIYQPVRRLMDAFRSINEMIFAMLFISAVGLGPFAGVLALFMHTLGTLAKLFSEAVEAIDPQPVEGIRATGANKMQEIAYGIIPQVVPLWISYSLYRFESNVRSASVVGMVGAGGIGMLLWDAIRSFNYGATAAMLLILVVVVSLLDLASTYVRKKFI